MGRFWGVQAGSMGKSPAGGECISILYGTVNTILDKIMYL